MASLDLIPRNEESLRIVQDRVNESFMRLTSAGDVVLRVPLDNISKTKGNLITFGRDQTICDIYLGSSKYYARTHCYIYIHPISGEFVLQDVSSSQSVGIGVEGGDDGRYFMQGVPRRRVLATSKCTVIGIRQAAFQLSWCGGPIEVQQAKMRHAKQRGVLTRTSVERESLPPPQHNTRVRQPLHGISLLTRIVHEPKGDLGNGTYGKVKLTVDLDSGNLLAVKQFPIRPELEKQQKEHVKVEVLLLSKLSHPHIAVFVHSQGWAMGELVELFMKPCDGTLRGLMDVLPPNSKEPYFYRTLQSQILDALAYLQQHKVVHCDVKPENILENGNGKIFYLADFGLSNYLANVRTGCGTRKYMSPEAANKEKIGTVADIWSFGVVLYEVIMGLPNWNSKWCQTIMGLASTLGRPDILPMLRESPRERYDARRCLLQYQNTASGTMPPSSSSVGPSGTRPEQLSALPRGAVRYLSSPDPRPPLHGLSQPRAQNVQSVNPIAKRPPVHPGQPSGITRMPPPPPRLPCPPLFQPSATGGPSPAAGANPAPDTQTPFGSQAGIVPPNPPVNRPPPQHGSARPQRLVGTKRNAEPTPNQCPQRVAGPSQQPNTTDKSRHKPRTRTDQ